MNYDHHFMMIRLPIYLTGVTRTAHNHFNNGDKKDWDKLLFAIGKILMIGDVSKIFGQQLLFCLIRRIN